MKVFLRPFLQKKKILLLLSKERENFVFLRLLQMFPKPTVIVKPINPPKLVINARKLLFDGIELEKDESGGRFFGEHIVPG
jgi:hypothetical protein